MPKKEITTKGNLIEVLDLLEELDIKYWIDGGWGVDILLGKQNREHRDIDIDYDCAYTDILLDALRERGYEIVTDWRPTRIELYHVNLGYIDIHPLMINEDGSAKQAGLNDDWYAFEASWFTSAVFEGREIPCISAQAQRLFHSGYELREVDIIDMKNLDSLIDHNVSDLNISDLMKMQLALYEQNKDRWSPMEAKYGRDFILWMMEEVGEVIAIIKKKGDESIMKSSSVRALFVEEMSDVLMYYMDTLLRYEVSPSEIAQAYVNKHMKNMNRNYGKEYKDKFNN